MEKTKDNIPQYVVSTPTDLGEKTIWNDVGVGFKTKAGNGINIILNALPVNGKLLVRKNEPKPKTESVL